MSGPYSLAMPYLEDVWDEESREVTCRSCDEFGEVEGTHYLDSETFRWQCDTCGYVNEIAAPVDNEPDPDKAYDHWRDERHGLIFP